jgi:hypothetical protein
MIMGGVPEHPGTAPAAGGHASLHTTTPPNGSRRPTQHTNRPATIQGYDQMELSNDELRATIKSLSITYDALGTKIGRLTGRHKQEAVAETIVVQSALNKFTAEQTHRWETDR